MLSAFFWSYALMQLPVGVGGGPLELAPAVRGRVRHLVFAVAVGVLLVGLPIYWWMVGESKHGPEDGAPG